MASVWCGDSSIDYNAVDGRVYGVIYNGEVLLDQWGYPEDREKIEKEGWKEALQKLVSEYRLNEKGKYGLGSYIYWMKENGLLDGNYLVQSITESRY